MFWASFEISKQLLRAFIRVPGSFIDFTAYFKTQIQFLKLQLGKIFLSQQLKALLSFISFLPFELVDVE